jgi:hypothetical protein
MNIINPKFKTILLISIAFLCLITLGCAAGGMTQIDPPSLNLDDAPSASPKVETIVDKDHSKTEWKVKRTYLIHWGDGTTYSECYVQCPVTKKWFFTTVDEDNKVVWSDGLWQEMQKNAKAYQAINDKDKDSDVGGGGGGGGGTCFHPKTKVLMADNSLKFIYKVQKGEKVKAYDIKNGIVVNREVMGGYRGVVKKYYIINGKLKVAAPHPFYTDQNVWIKLENLKKGQQIKSVEDFTTIRSITTKKKKQKVYNIIVSEFHNFFVLDKGKNFFLVHEGDKYIIK